MTGLIMLEGLPGSGKSTTAHGLAEWLAGRGVAVEHWAEGRTDHPVDFEQVAVLTNDDVVRILGEMPGSADALIRAAERSGDAWLVRHTRHPGLPAELVERLRAHDGYDGSITPELHSKVLTASWRAFGGRGRPAAVQVWECVLVQNPLCALMARFDQPEDVLERHVRGLVEAVSGQAPALVYLDPGDPATILERAAAERSAEWLESVVEYHTGQGYGLAHGLTGFDGYVEFMRHRRDIELALLPRLPLPTLVVRTGEGDWSEYTRLVRSFVADHLGLDPVQVA
jgi:hypothetical protein